MPESDNRDVLERERRQKAFEERKRSSLLHKRYRRNILGRRLITLILLMSIGLVTYMLLWQRIEKPLLPLMLLMGVAFSIFALTYLQPSPVARDFMGMPNEFSRLRHYVDAKLLGALEQIKHGTQGSTQFTETDKTAILANIQAKLESDALKTYVSNIREMALSCVREETLDERFQLTRRRLGQEILDLGRRGNLNLILGILTTLSGLSVLSFAVFNLPISHSATELMSFFVPRVSLVVLIEIFAYFFLRLYKQSLSEIKYFQNEITNIEAKQLALYVALPTNDVGLRAELSKELAKTERNFILTKDQTTVDLERERLTHSTNVGITEAVKEFFKKHSNG